MENDKIINIHSWHVFELSFQFDLHLLFFKLSEIRLIEMYIRHKYIYIYFIFTN